MHLETKIFYDHFYTWRITQIENFDLILGVKSAHYISARQILHYSFIFSLYKENNFEAIFILDFIKLNRAMKEIYI